MKKINFFRRVFPLLALLIFAVGSVWAEDIATSREWKVTSFANLKAGDVVIISNNFNNSLKSNQTVTKSAANIDITPTAVVGKENTYTITYTGATKLNDIAWTVASGTNGKKFYVYGSASNLLYLAKTGDNNALGVGAGANNTDWVMGSNGYLLLNYGNGRYCGKYVSGSDWRTYNSETANNYKSNSTQQTLVFYVLQSSATKYGIYAYAATNGSYTVNTTNVSAYTDLGKNFEAGDKVTLTANPNSGYKASTTCWNVLQGSTPVSVNAEATANTYSFTMPAGNVSITPVYVANSASTKLSTPVNLSTTAISATSATLSWDAVANASSYELTVMDENADLVKDGVSVSETSYELTGLSANVTYTWTVKAIGDGVNYTDSEESGDVDFTTLAQGGDPTPQPIALSAPANLASSNVTATGATLTWDAVSNASSYTVKIGSTEYVNATSPYSATGLTAATEYTWTVKAVGDGVNYSTSEYAANANFTTEAEQGGGDEPSGDEMSIDFESEANTYTDWTLTNINTKQTNSNVPAHGGSYFGNTAGTQTASIVTKETVANPRTITFYVSKQTTNTTSSNWKIQVSSNGTSWNDVKTQSATSMDRGSWVEVSQDLTEYSNVYVRVYYTGSTAVRCIDDLTLTLAADDDPVDPSKTTPTLSFANPTYNATMGEAFTAPTLTNSQNVTVTYSSSAEDVATVNATTGAVSLVAAGTTTITASFEGDEDYNPASASYDLVVKVATPVFASLEELVAADLASGTEVTVSFENVAIKSFQTVSSVRKGVYFDIQKAGKDIEIYFNAEIPAEWAVGGTLSGTLTNCPWKLYSSTWELAPASGWAWSNLNYTAPANYAPAITTQPVSATYEFNASAANLTVAASGNPAPSYQWYSNTTNSNENGTILTGETNASYKPSTATAGTFYYYCVATNSEGSATSNVATITVKEPNVASLPFSFDGGRDDIASKNGMSHTGLGSDYSSSPKLKFDTQGDNVIIHFNEAAKKVTYTIKGNSTSGTYAFDVMESTDGVNYTTIHSHTSITDAATYTDNLTSTSRFVKFVYTTKANGNVALGGINIIAASYREEPNLAFDKAAYKFIAGKTMQVVATSKAGSTAAITYALTEGDADAFSIDENTGAITCETAGTYTVTATIAETADYYSRSTTCTVNVLDPIVGNSIIVAGTDGGYYAMTTTCAGEYFTHKAIKKVDDQFVVNSLDDILFCTNTADGKTTIQSTANNEYVQATAAKKISYTEDEYKWTNDGEKLTAANNAYGTLQYNTGSPRFTTYTSKVGQYATIVDLANVVVGDVVTLAAKDGEDYYATFSSNKDVEFVDATVYTVSVDNDGVMSLTEVASKQVPANAGVLVKTSGTTAVYTYIDDAENLDNNMLYAASVDKATLADCKFYKLAYASSDKDALGFYWGADQGAAFTSREGSAYLAVPAGAGLAPQRFVFNEANTATGVENLENSEDAVKFMKDGQLFILRNGVLYNAIGQIVK